MPYSHCGRCRLHPSDGSGGVFWHVEGVVLGLFAVHRDCFATGILLAAADLAAPDGAHEALGIAALELDDEQRADLLCPIATFSAAGRG